MVDTALTPFLSSFPFLFSLPFPCFFFFSLFLSFRFSFLDNKASWNCLSTPSSFVCSRICRLLVVLAWLNLSARSTTSITGKAGVGFCKDGRTEGLTRDGRTEGTARDGRTEDREEAEAREGRQETEGGDKAGKKEEGEGREDEEDISPSFNVKEGVGEASPSTSKAEEVTSRGVGCSSTRREISSKMAKSRRLMETRAVEKCGGR